MVQCTDHPNVYSCQLSDVLLTSDTASVTHIYRSFNNRPWTAPYGTLVLLGIPNIPTSPPLGAFFLPSRWEVSSLQNFSDLP